MPRSIPEFHHDFLYNAYVVEQKSLDDIALECQCTRPGVWKALRRCGIPTRSRAEARKLSLHRRRPTVTDTYGNIRFTQSITCDEKFLSTPSCGLSWLTGVLHESIYTMVNRYGNPKLRLKFSIFAPETDLLPKAMSICKCNAKIRNSGISILQQDFLQAIVDSRENIHCPACYLRGLFDAHPGIDPDLTPLCSISSLTPDLPKFVHAIVKKQFRINGDLFISPDQRNHRVRFFGKQVAELSKILYSHSTPETRGDRAFNLFKIAAWKYGVQIN